jgi:hypothetical protein
MWVILIDTLSESDRRNSQGLRICSSICSRDEPFVFQQDILFVLEIQTQKLTVITTLTSHDTVCIYFHLNYTKIQLQVCQSAIQLLFYTQR